MQSNNDTSFKRGLRGVRWDAANGVTVSTSAIEADVSESSGTGGEMAGRVTVGGSYRAMQRDKTSTNGPIEQNVGYQNMMAVSRARREAAKAKGFEKSSQTTAATTTEESSSNTDCSDEPGKSKATKGESFRERYFSDEENSELASDNSNGYARTLAMSRARRELAKAKKRSSSELSSTTSSGSTPQQQQQQAAAAATFLPDALNNHDFSESSKYSSAAGSDYPSILGPITDVDELAPEIFHLSQPGSFSVRNLDIEQQQPESAVRSSTMTNSTIEEERISSTRQSRDLENNHSQIIDCELPSGGGGSSNDKEQQPKSSGRKLRFSIFICVFLVVAIVVVIAVVIPSATGGGGGRTPTEDEELSTPTHDPTIVPVELIQDLLPDYTMLALEDESSPQSKALAWLHTDPMITQYETTRILTRFAMATFYHATNGNNWHNSSNWLSHDVHECGWYTTSGLSSCQHLEIGSNGLEGTIPREIALLSPSLHRIDLRNNHITNFPEELGFLTLLEYVDLDNNGLQGSIPTTLGLIGGNIMGFSARNNSLTGQIPSELGLLSNLVHFDVSFNELNGSIPSEIGLLTDLEELHLTENSLESVFPTEIGLLSSAELFNISGNLISGSIPSEISGIGRLARSVRIDMSESRLTGVLPTNIGLFTGIHTLTLNNNLLGGMLPSEIGQLTDITFLRLNNNHFTGSIPSEIEFLTNLRQFRAGSNSFTGDLRLVPARDEIDFSNNDVSGSLPLELGSTLSRIRTLVLNGNNFTNTIPSTLGLLTNLESLHLHNNSLSGTVPDELCSLFEHEDLIEIVIDCEKVECSCGCTCGGSSSGVL